ncbi:hypothetical protein [Candidatus Nitrososphaera evergladensis]|uniref:hypothetical protein n=1 Tax=Candidatus Nitrososphaera evergladensis TaxID=1459637 RepID=UPI0011E59AF8|nr:hypothetical protein [Candidatus Nitrososphaera evergladensis]
MNTEIPERLWLPLLILDKSDGVIHGKTKFQKLTFLTQVLAHIDEYDFRKYHYGPFSDLLELDLSAYSGLVTIVENESMMNYGQHYFSFYLTSNGKKEIEKMKKELLPRTLEKVENIIESRLARTRCELLDEVYSKFGIDPKDSLKLAAEVKKELENILPPLIECSRTYNNRQSAFVLSTLEIIGNILKALESVSDTAKRGVALYLSRELIHKIADTSKDVRPPANSELLRPRFLEIAELESYLLGYCDKRKIYNNPFERTLDEAFTEEEAKRLAQSLSNLNLTA